MQPDTSHPAGKGRPSPSSRKEPDGPSGPQPCWNHRRRPTRAGDGADCPACRPPVIIANSRGPASLTSVVSALGAGASAGTVEQASAASIVVIAVPWGRVPVAVQGLEWNGQIVIDATNDFDPSDLDGEPQASVSPASSAVRAWSRPRTPRRRGLGADPHEAQASEHLCLRRRRRCEVRSDRAVPGRSFVAIDLGDLIRGGGMQQVRGPLAGVP